MERVSNSGHVEEIKESNMDKSTITFSFRRADGFEATVCVPVSSDAIIALDSLVAKVVAAGGSPVTIHPAPYKKYEAKPVEYVEGKVCPKCGKKVVRSTTKDGRVTLKCEDNKYDYKTKVQSGCTFFEFEHSADGRNIPLPPDPNR